MWGVVVKMAGLFKQFRCCKHGRESEEPYVGGAGRMRANVGPPGAQTSQKDVLLGPHHFWGANTHPGQSEAFTLKQQAGSARV